MKKLAFITSEDDPALINDDRLAFAPLLKLGFTVEPFVWDSDTHFKDFDAFIFRSCWNYHRKLDLFLEWVDKLEDSKIPVLNSLKISRWNLNKKYLLELEQKGILIPETVWLKKGSTFKREELTKISSEKAVVKPAVSLNGHDTYLFSKNDVDKIEAQISELLIDRDVLVQEFVPEISTAGEISLLFFNGIYSHAIRKLPSSGEFRIHTEYGGTKAPFYPDADLISQAQNVLSKIDEDLLFARVDIIERQGKAILIELEIIDPMLFLGYSPTAPEIFAEAIRNQLTEK